MNTLFARKMFIFTATLTFLSHYFFQPNVYRIMQVNPRLHLLLFTLIHICEIFPFRVLLGFVEVNPIGALHVLVKKN